MEIPRTVSPNPSPSGFVFFVAFGSPHSRQRRERKRRELVLRFFKVLLGTSFEVWFDEAAEALAQIGEVVCRLKMDRSPFTGVEEIAVQDFVRAADLGTPSFEHVLLPGVVLGVGIQIQVASHLRAQVGLVEAPECVEQARVFGQSLSCMRYGVG
jgi:hypothetical protein